MQSIVLFVVLLAVAALIVIALKEKTFDFAQDSVFSALTGLS